MLIADKYEIDITMDVKPKTLLVTLHVPDNLIKENQGIVEQLYANQLFGIIDDFPIG